MMFRAPSRFLLGTLRGRLMLGMAAVHAVVMAIFVVDLTARQRAMLLDRQLEEATTLSEALATSAAGWIAADDVSGLQELVEVQRRHPELAFAILTDKDGRVLADTDTSRLGKYVVDLPREARRTSISRTPALVDVAVPAVIGGRHVGWARIGIGQKLAGEKLATITRSGGVYALLAILIGSAIAWLIGLRFTRRLRSVQKTIDAVRSGNRSARSATTGTDEAADMAREFNTMLDALADRDAELRASEEKYRSLLQKVQTAIVLHDGGGRILTSNVMAREVLGLSEDQLAGKALIDPDWHFLREDRSVMPVAEYPASMVLSARQPLRGYVAGVARPGRDDVSWVLVNAEPEYDEAGKISLVIVSFVDITERKRAEALLNGQKRVLELVAAGVPLAETLASLVRVVEEHAPGVLASILLLDADGVHLRHGAAPSLPAEYSTAIDGASVGPNAGSCGLAAYRKESVFVEDLATDPPWDALKAAALPHGLRACWSTPILDAQLSVIGTVAMYYRMSAPPPPEHERLVDLVTHTAALAIGHHRISAALVESAERLRLAVQASNIGLWDWDIRSDKVVFSREWKRQIGFEEHEIGSAFDEWESRISPEDLAPTMAKLRACRAGLRPEFEAEYRLLHKSGAYRWIYARGEVLRDADGEPFRILGCHLDITDRKQAEAALRRLNRELRAISECSETLMRAEDEEALLRDVCRIVCDVAGYRMAWVGYALNDDAKTIRRVASGGVEDGYVEQARITWGDTEDRGRGPSGSALRSGESACIQDFATDPQAAPWREIALRRGYRSSIALPLKNEENVPFGVLCIYSFEPNAFTPNERRLLDELAADLAFGISVLRARIERRRVEEALRTERGLFVGGPTVVFKWRAQEGWPVEYVSPNVAAQFGYTPDALISGKPEYASIVHPDDLARIAAEVSAYEAQGASSFEQLYRIAHADGRFRWIDDFTTIIRGRDGAITHYLGYVQDVTERKQAEEEVRRLNQELQRRIVDRTSQLELTNRELEAFAYSVAHDLRAPLRHIDGFLGLLKEKSATALDEESLRYISTISVAARRMGTLIDDLLSFVRMGRTEMAKSRVALGPLVQELVREFEASEPERVIRWRIHDLPTVAGDRDMLRVVVANLISNAVKFTRRRPEADIEIGSKPGSEGETVVFVRDNGIGFDMKYSDKLFGVFQRLHRSDEFEGTGIGLANVRRVINRHGGRTWAEGHVDEGAAFYFSLPD